MAGSWWMFYDVFLRNTAKNQPTACFLQAFPSHLRDMWPMSGPSEGYFSGADLQPGPDLGPRGERALRLAAAREWRPPGATSARHGEQGTDADLRGGRGAFARGG